VIFALEAGRVDQESRRRRLAGQRRDLHPPERFPAFARNMQRSIENALNQLELVEALGIKAGILLGAQATMFAPPST
jgi:hypothetical protein